eukprot:TRINITY_DN4416_c0_g1_i3.p1 TRINITY_DN4416_c0_g1~~TRINITY_DN4416_c0_g1_i3.p1  ORF type:complete len:484 (+),score=123.36 TRINITY_DN4416_c0_g1_i3:87-1454(+)
MGNKQATLTEDSATIQPHDFEFVKLIGKGGFAKVYQVRKKDTGEIYAMKVMLKSVVVRTNMIQHTNLEADIMGSFGNHPFICRLYYAFQTEDKLCFVLEYFNGGSLWNHLSQSDEPFDEPTARFYAAEILMALETLHSHDIVYRDLKLENILLDSEGHVHLTDFGLSHKMVNRKNVHSFSGTPAYLAPEILTDDGKGHGKSVDWWSFGVLLHLMFAQEPPFWADDNKSLYNKIMKDKVMLKCADHLSPEAVSLLRGLLTRDERYRLGVCSPVRDHPFFAGVNWDDVINMKLKPPIKPQVSGYDDYRYFETLTPTEADKDPLAPEVDQNAKYPSMPHGIQKQFKRFQFLPVKETKETSTTHVAKTASIATVTATATPTNTATATITTTTSPATSPPTSPPTSPRKVTFAPSTSPPEEDEEEDDPRLAKQRSWVSHRKPITRFHSFGEKKPGMSIEH